MIAASSPSPRGGDVSFSQLGDQGQLCNFCHHMIFRQCFAEFHNPSSGAAIRGSGGALKKRPAPARSVLGRMVSFSHRRGKFVAKQTRQPLDLVCRARLRAGQQVCQSSVISTSQNRLHVIDRSLPVGASCASVARNARYNSGAVTSSLIRHTKQRKRDGQTARKALTI